MEASVVIQPNSGAFAALIGRATLIGHNLVAEPEIGLSPAFLRPNKTNKAKLSSVSECLHSGVSLVRGGKTRLTRINSGVGILE